MLQPLPYRRGATIAVIPRNAKLRTPLCTADGIMTLTISLINRGSNTHLSGSRTGPFFLDGTRCITPRRSITPARRDRIEAYADPAYPERRETVEARDQCRVEDDVYDIHNDHHVHRRPGIPGTLKRGRKNHKGDKYGHPHQHRGRENVPQTTATSGSAPRSRRRSCDQKAPMAARTTAKASTR